MSKSLSLPPGGAAALTPAIIAAITALVSPQDIAEGIRKLLDAKLSNGQGDVRAIESGIKLYLNYTVGLPVQRVEETQTRVNVNVDPEKLLSNPASLEAIARKLRGTEAGTRLLEALAGQPRDVTGRTRQSPDDDTSGGALVPA